MGILNFEAISFQSLRALGSATPQRPEQSADQVHEGAGGEGGGGGGQEGSGGAEQVAHPGRVVRGGHDELLVSW